MTLFSGRIINNNLLVRATEKNGFEDDQSEFLNYVYHELDLTPAQIAIEYFNGETSYQTILSWIKKCNIKIKKAYSQSKNRRNDITKEKVFELCIDKNGPLMSLRGAAKKLNCSHHVISRIKKDFFFKGKKRNVSKKYQEVLVPQKTFNNKRVCRSCGCDPYPNYWYCPVCLKSRNHPDSLVDIEVSINL